MNDKNEVLIQVQDLKKAFGKLEVLRGISTEIKKGEVVVVIGPSGSGKSTFLRSLNLLEVPTGGTVLFEGTDITDPKTDIDVHQISGLLDALRCQADILATCIHNSLGLVHTSLCILRRRVGHRLDTNRIGAAQRYSPNIYFCGFSSKIIE